MKNWQFLIICGLLLSIRSDLVIGIESHFLGMLAGLVTGYGLYRWWADKPKK